MFTLDFLDKQSVNTPFQMHWTYVGKWSSYFILSLCISFVNWTFVKSNVGEYVPPILRMCIALFAVAEGWLLLDIGWYLVLISLVLFLFALSSSFYYTCMHNEVFKITCNLRSKIKQCKLRKWQFLNFSYWFVEFKEHLLFNSDLHAPM